MEMLFAFGLLGLLGAYLFLRAYAFLLKEMGDEWGARGWLAGLVPPVQWVYALARPRRGLAPLGTQLLGLVLLAPSASVLYVVSLLLNGNFRFG
jgi:hypothetical protein